MGYLKLQLLIVKDGLSIIPHPSKPEHTYLRLKERQPTIHSKSSPRDVKRQSRHEQFSDDSQEQYERWEAYQLPLGVSDVCERLIRIRLRDEVPRPSKEGKNVGRIDSGANDGKPFWG